MALRKYFVGSYQTYSGPIRHPLFKANSDDSLDTSWGTDGYWDYEDPDTGDGPDTCCDLLQLSDGRILLLTDNFWIEESGWPDEGKLIALTMLTADGVIDTSWGYNGFYPITWGTTYQKPFVRGVRILQCNDGTFLLVASCNSGSRHVLHKISANGTMIATRDYDVYPDIVNPHDAIWGDSGHTFIIIIGNFGNYPSSSYFSNAVAVDAETLEPYTGWGGMGYDVTAGYSNIGPAVTENGNCSLSNIIDVGDGFVLVHSSQDLGGYEYTMCKINSDGSAYDTSFGVNGHAESGDPSFYGVNGYSLCYDGTYIYTLTFKCVNGVTDLTKQILKKFDLTGTLVDSHEITVTYNDWVYRTIAVIDNHLLLGTEDNSPAYDQVERWTKDFVYMDSFDPGSMTYADRIIPLTLPANRQLIIGNPKTGYPVRARHVANRNVFM